MKKDRDEEAQELYQRFREILIRKMPWLSNDLIETMYKDALKSSQRPELPY